MFVGVGRVVLQIPGARSLKDKRAVVRSFKDRAQARFRLSFAEVGALDDVGRSVVGFSVVSNEAAVCDEVLAAVASYAGTLRDAVLADYATEVIPFSPDGLGVGLGERARRTADGRDDGGEY